MYIVDCATTRTGTRYSRCQRREHWHRLFVHTVDNGTHWYPRRWHRPCTGTGCHAARIIRHFRRNAHKRKFHIMLTISATICSYAYTTTQTGTRYIAEVNDANTSMDSWPHCEQWPTPAAIHDVDTGPCPHGSSWIAYDIFKRRKIILVALHWGRFMALHILDSSN